MDLEGFGNIWEHLVRLVKIWEDLVGFGEICLDLGELDRI